MRRATLEALAVLGLGLPVLTAFVVPSLIEPGGRNLEGHATNVLRMITTAQNDLRERRANRKVSYDYAGNLGQLIDAGLLPEDLRGGVRGGYAYRLIRSRTEPEFLWAAAADPIVPGKTGSVYFATNHQGETYYATSGPIPLDPETCEVFPGTRHLGE